MRSISITLLLFTSLFSLGQVAPEKVILNVELDYITNYSDTSATCFLSVYTIENDQKVQVPNVLCNLYLTEISRGGMMGSTITDNNGEATFPLVNKFNAAKDTISQYLFICRIANDERFVSIDDTTLFLKSNLSAQFLEQDETYSVESILNTDSELTSGNTTLSIQISNDKETIFKTKASQMLPNESLNTQIPNNLIGDSIGNININVMLKSDVYGTHVYTVERPWGMEKGDAQYTTLLRYIFWIVLVLMIAVFAYILKSNKKKK